MDTDDLEAQLHRLTDRIDSLEAENEHLEDRVEELEAENEQLRKECQPCVNDALVARLDALATKTDANLNRISELQSRELEKGAHLREDHVYPNKLTTPEGRLEQFAKDDGQYVRIPGAEDALNRGGPTHLAHGDLLPIQQLARLDDDMLASESRPTRLAVEVWEERTRDAEKSRTTNRLWKRGCGDVHSYLDGGDLATWIRVHERGVNADYAQKLASRTIDMLLDLTNGRLYDELRSHRKDGLKYKEKRLILPTDSAIPGESPTPQTADVGGQ